MLDEKQKGKHVAAEASELEPLAPRRAAAEEGGSEKITLVGAGIATRGRAQAEGAHVRSLAGMCAERIVLAPVDDSDHSEAAVKWACDNFLRPGGEDVLHLLCVVPSMHPSSAMAYGGPMVWVEELEVFAAPLAMSVPGPVYFEQLERDERQMHLQDKRNAEGFMKRRFADALREKGIKFVLDITRGSLDNWSIGEVVCNTAAQLGASAVVMAPHGKGRVKEWFVGSVANHCLHHCKAPLIIVRPGAYVRAVDPATSLEGASAGERRRGGGVKQEEFPARAAAAAAAAAASVPNGAGSDWSKKNHRVKEEFPARAAASAAAASGGCGVPGGVKEFP